MVPEPVAGTDLKLWKFSIQTEIEAQRSERLEPLRCAHPYVLGKDREEAITQARAAIEKEWGQNADDDEGKGYSLQWQTLAVTLAIPEVVVINPNSPYGKTHEVVTSFTFRPIPIANPQ